MTQPAPESEIARLRAENAELVKANCRLILDLYHAVLNQRALVATVGELQEAILSICRQSDAPDSAPLIH